MKIKRAHLSNLQRQQQHRLLGAGSAFRPRNWPHRRQGHPDCGCPRQSRQRWRDTEGLLLLLPCSH